MQVERFAVDQTDLAHVDLVCHERIDAKIADAFLRILRVGIDLGGDHDADPALYKAQRSDNVAAH